MRLSWWILAASIVAASPGVAHDDSTRTVDIGSVGADKCAAWAEDRSATSEPARLASERRIEWVSGFFSAVNVFDERSGELHGSIDDRDGMLAWIDNYCRTHPSDPLWSAAANLVLNLRNNPHN